jgi:hypothetical protein
MNFYIDVSINMRISNKFFIAQNKDFRSNTYYELTNGAYVIRLMLLSPRRSNRLASYSA